MNINKHNYEAFFLDYHEGNLTPQEVAELLLFVEQHPELKEEFESFENFSLEDYSSYTFENKESLKKNLTPALSKEEGEGKIIAENCENYFVRSVDGTLTEAEADLLNVFLKQHPQYSTEFELFQKTKLIPDTQTVFENKSSLKRDLTPALSFGDGVETADNLLIAAVEGLLTKEESSLFKQQLSVDAEIRQRFEFYQQTKIQADLSVVYENKEELKQNLTPALCKREGEYRKKEDQREVIPLFYYVSSIAAAILLLFGLFVIFNNENSEKQKIAKTIPQLKETDPVKEQLQSIKENTNTPVLTNDIVSVAKNKVTNTSVAVNKDSLKNTPIINEQPINIVQNVQSPEITEELPEEPLFQKSNEPVPAVNSNTVAKADDVNKAKEFLSLGQIAATKIKEKTLDPEVLEMEKKNGRLKKFSGWDILQVVAKGASKLTGKKVEAKPTYNEEGEVTAYALGAGGFQISRGR
jgi:hypothetical protein